MGLVRVVKNICVWSGGKGHTKQSPPFKVTKDVEDELLSEGLVERVERPKPAETPVVKPAPKPIIKEKPVPAADPEPVSEPEAKEEPEVKPKPKPKKIRSKAKKKVRKK